MVPGSPCVMARPTHLFASICTSSTNTNTATAQLLLVTTRLLLAESSSKRGGIRMCYSGRYRLPLSRAYRYRLALSWLWPCPTVTANRAPGADCLAVSGCLVVWLGGWVAVWRLGGCLAGWLVAVPGGGAGWVVPGGNVVSRAGVTTAQIPGVAIPGSDLHGRAASRPCAWHTPASGSRPCSTCTALLISFSKRLESPFIYCLTFHAACI